MIEHIIADLNQKFRQMVPEVRREIPALEEFSIIPGAMLGLDPNVVGDLRDDIERAKYYIVLRFSNDGNREQAVNAFKTMMEEKLGLPSTEDVNDEVLPREDYQDRNAQTASQADDVIDIDDDGNVVNNAVAPMTGTDLIATPNKKYYAVEFRVEAPRGLPGPRGGHQLGGEGRMWNPHRQIGQGGRGMPMLGY